MITAHIDWLQFSIAWDVDTVTQWLKRALSIHDDFRPCKPVLPFYSQAASNDGVTVMWGRGVPTHIVMPGNGLETVRGLGNGDTSIIRALPIEAQPSRLDVSWDVRDEAFDWVGLETDIAAITASDARRVITEVKGLNKNGGRTIYIGSPKSEKRVRVYDKSAEQGVPGQWVRIELQLRGDAAKALIKAFRTFPSGWQGSASGVLAALLSGNKNCDHVAQIVRGATFPPPDTGDARVSGKYERWVSDQVIPALLGMAQSGGEGRVLLRLIKMTVENLLRE